MALETNHPKAPEPKKDQAKDQPPQEHDTTSGPTYGTTEGVKDSDEQFEQVLVPKKQASNVEEPKPDDVETNEDQKKNAKKHEAGKK